LEELFICEDSLTDISGLKNLTNLKILQIYASGDIQDFSAILNLVNLERLEISTKSAKNLNFLKNLTNLHTLHLEMISEIKNFKPLKNLTALKQLYFTHSYNLSRQEKRGIEDVLPNCSIEFY
jgi:light-regulated signal transduction histidine kinase (bacteriophytochrome)